MSRKEYIRELVERLGHMAEADRMEAIRYYQEYFDEAGPENEEEVIKNLGTPQQVAKQILAEYAVKETIAMPQSPKKGLSAMWWIIIVIIASPIAFPVAMTAIGLIIGLFGAIFGLLVAGVATVFALGVSGIAVLMSGVAMIAWNPAMGTVYLGVALAVVGVAILVALGVYMLLVKVMPIAIQKVYEVIKRLIRKGERV